VYARDTGLGVGCTNVMSRVETLRTPGAIGSAGTVGVVDASRVKPTPATDHESIVHDDGLLMIFVI